MTASDPWPFDQAPSVVAMTSAQVIAGSPITHVYHFEEDESWVFIHDVGISNQDGRLIRMDTAVKIDPTLVGIADLTPGWEANRADIGQPWTRSRAI